MHRKTLIDDHAKWSELACLFFWERPAFLALFFFFSLHHRSPMGENMEQSLESVHHGGKMELKQAGVCSAVCRPQRRGGRRVPSHSGGASESPVRSRSAEQLRVAPKHVRN